MYVNCIQSTYLLITSAYVYTVKKFSLLIIALNVRLVCAVSLVISNWNYVEISFWNFENSSGKNQGNVREFCLLEMLGILPSVTTVIIRGK